MSNFPLSVRSNQEITLVLILVLSPGQTITTFQRNISQHVACVWHPVATCCDMLGVVGSNLKMVKFFMQHLWMLHDVVVVWPGSCNNVAPGHAH